MDNKQRELYFWERDRASKIRARFNLLLLEYGEYFFEDKGVYFVPVPNDDSDKSLELSDAIKIQGRLKLCSRSLVFEPSDSKKPIVKFPFKSMSKISSFSKLNRKKFVTLIDITGYFTFDCSNYYEIKPDNTIGPYKLIDFDNKKSNIVISLIHSDIDNFLQKVNELRDIFLKNENKSFLSSSNSLSTLASDFSTVLNFDTSLLVDFHEKLLMQFPVPVKKISPLVLNPGGLMITNSRIYFQPAQLNNVGDKVLYFEMKSVQRVYCRRFLLLDTALEFKLNDGRSYLFVFDDIKTRNNIHDILTSQSDIPKSVLTLAKIQQMWQKREITNSEYLMYINNEAGRSLNDLTQYPVFPHVISDYTSRSLKLDKPSTYRDLSKPVGALDPKRLEYFLERYNSMPPGDPANGIPPPFMYGTHYSTPGYVLYYLVRVAPEHLLNLQNGKFDAPDRMFFSVAENWKSCLNNPADLKELIPEFFLGSGEFLLNTDDLDLGQRQTGEKLNDIELPPWAKSSKDFIRKNLKALESDYVSENLHHWIDLIFGYKQQGIEAERAHNVFYYLTYAGAVELNDIKSDHERAALEAQIQEFGQTPKQIFFYPHPSRNGNGNANGDVGGHIKQESETQNQKEEEEKGDEEKSIFSDHVSISPAKPSPPTASHQENNNTIVNDMNSAFVAPGEQTDLNKTSDKPRKTLTLFESLSGKTANFLDRTFSSFSSSFVKSNEADSDQKSSSISSKILFGEKSVKYSLRPVTPLLLLHSAEISGISYDKVSFTLCTSSKDGTAKVINFNHESALSRNSTKPTKESATLNVLWTIANINNQAFSSCVLGPNGSYVILSGWDNCLYTYSCNPNTKILLSHLLAHQDAVTSIDVEKYGYSWLVSGSWDLRIRLWKIHKGQIDKHIECEFEGSRSSIHTVALAASNSRRVAPRDSLQCLLYLASGSEDGMVTVWTVEDQKILFQIQISPEQMPISIIKWLVSEGNYYCVVGTIDGILSCINTNGDVVAMKHFGTQIGIKTLDIFENFIFCALDDGSLQLYQINTTSGKYTELLNIIKAHETNRISAICVIPLEGKGLKSSTEAIVFTGCESGSIKVWAFDKFK